jgi:hypothetical protein
MDEPSVKTKNQTSTKRKSPCIFFVGRSVETSLREGANGMGRVVIGMLSALAQICDSLARLATSRRAIKMSSRVLR